MVFDKAIEYLEYNFQFVIDAREWQGKSDLPLYLAKGFDFIELLIEGQRILMINCSRKEELGIEEIMAHLRAIRDKGKYKGEIILLFKNITNYHREKLIKEGQSFIISGKQVYSPILGLIFVEKMHDRFKTADNTETRLMKPTTQALLLELISSNDFKRSAQEVGRRLDVTKMSITRAYKDLEEMAIVSKSAEYYLSEYRLINSNKETWEMLIDKFIDPVLKRVYVDEAMMDDALRSELCISGESALSLYTMLGHPKHKVFGITNKRFKKFVGNIKTLPYADSHSCILEIWRHEMPTVEGILHPLAVALEMKYIYDERIEDQTNQMIERYFDKEM